jgi:site-specific recombinase XerD
MGDLVLIRNTAGRGSGLPALVARAGKGARTRFLEFFTVNIRNPNTRAAYHRAALDFLHWCEANGIGGLDEVQPVQVAAYIEQLGRHMKPPSVKQHLACIRMLFDWLVTGQVVPLIRRTPFGGLGTRSARV